VSELKPLHITVGLPVDILAQVVIYAQMLCTFDAY